MDIRFQPNNTHRESASQFAQTDPHLKRLAQQRLIYRSDLINQFPWQTPGILTLTGGRQIGKTTLLKQWMAFLLGNGIQPNAISFFSGELISDYQSLYQLIQIELTHAPNTNLIYCIIDEVSYIKDWDRAIKYLADIGLLENTVLMLSGSDSVLIQDARKRFPGRRGLASQVDFHYYPLSFAEYVQLQDTFSLEPLESPEPLKPKELIKTIKTVTPKVIDQLYQAFDRYLIHGGFLTAINDYEKHQLINPATFMVYSDWIRGDMLKRNKKEIYVRELIAAIIKHYTKQISWDNLVKELSIDHTQTVADYIGLLSSMDATLIQHALNENSLGPAPKKRKKVLFADPFIYHALYYWLNPIERPFEQQILPIFNDPIAYSILVEACVVSQFNRYYPTYYIKSKGEVDIAYIADHRFHPIEIKWTNQLRSKDLQQIGHYPNGKIFSKCKQFSRIELNQHQLPIYPLPLALLDLPAMQNL